MELSLVVPWGRSFAEYQSMFALSEADLERRILGCGDGVASFNAELFERGGQAVSVDPIYQYSVQQIRQRIQRVYPNIIAQVARQRGQYVWTSFRDPGHLGSVRMSAMNRFLGDYAAGLEQGRYLAASLPTLPFADGEFDLALCSHLLFTYSEQLDTAQHLQALLELARVTQEVRVYPLVGMDGYLSPHVDEVISALRDAQYRVERQAVAYEFQKGATEMLCLSK